MSALPARPRAFAGLLLPLLIAASVVTGGCAAEPEDDSEASADPLTGTPPSGTTPAAGSVLDCSVLVVGGGTGGMAAGIAAARVGMDTCVTEETDWVGGQLTAQGLNASDDSRFTDTIGATRTYQKLRTTMRARYGGRANPGNCWVSRLCAEPRVALDALGALSRDLVASGKLKIFYRLKPAAVDASGGRVRSVTLARNDGGSVTIRAKQTVDATELGDIIKLSGTAYRLGQEPKSDTGEPEAPAVGCTACVQSLTYDVVLERRPAGESHVIPKPDGYGVKPWMKGFGHQTFAMFGAHGVWEYRRIVDGAASGGTDLSVMNWGAGGNDYPFGGIIDVPEAEAKEQLSRARERALAYVYWLQTEVDGHGYPNLKMRSDVLGTDTGVAKTPYIREARRIRALETVRTTDVSDAYVTGARARTFDTSVGIGLYPLDMHQNVAEGTAYARGHSLPYQVPMGALVPETMNGLVAGAKNIGTTHMVSSAYRLHPIEWAIGEAAGTLAAYSVSWKNDPRDVLADEGHLRELQARLIADGAPLYWIDDVEVGSALWKDVQLAATSGIMGGPDPATLHFLPNAGVTRAQIATALVRALGIAPVTPRGQFSDVPASHWAAGAVEALAAKGIVTGTGGGAYSPDAPVTSEQLRAMIGRALGDATASAAVASPGPNAMSRGQAATSLVTTYRSRLHLP
ncbi:MAG: Endoglucanase [Labilithrix sp.]|nr:Endoglucanase [Labilithrix sp.]